MKFEKFATPISIIIAGLLIGAGIIISKTMPTSSGAPTAAKGDLDDRLVTLATSLGLDKKDFAACLAKGKKEEIEKDKASGAAAGAVGTPYYILTFKDGRKPFAIPGAAPEQMFNDLLDGKSVEGFTPEPLENFEPVSADDHIRGAVNPEVTLIEYSDADCPFCHRSYPVVDKIMKERGNIALVYRHLPLENIHPEAYRKAEASECAAELGGNDAFWAYTDKLMEGTE